MRQTTIENMIFGQPEEHDVPHLELSGNLPDFVEGVYYLNGPANFHDRPQPQRHWLDGDGMARALRISAERISYASRLIRTPKFKKEQQAGQALFRTFGTAFDGDQLRKGLALESPANVSLYFHGGKLLAFGEQSLPQELDPRGLESKGEFNFNGRFPDLAPFSAHPKYDHPQKQMHTFGITYFGGRGKLAYYIFDDQYQLLQKGTSLLKEGNYIHDFALSPSYACFHLAPYRLDVHSFAKKGLPLHDALNWQNDGAFEFRIFCRKSGQLATVIPLERKAFCLHSINAWEQDGMLAIDLVDTPKPFFDQYYARPLMFEAIKPCAAVRYLIDTSTWTLCEKHVVESSLHYDFPSVAQSAEMMPYQYFWALGMAAEPEPAPKFYNRLLRYDWHAFDMVEMWQCEDGMVLGGEPQLVENPSDPNKAVVISQYCDLAGGNSGYLFLDAFHLGQGPIARLDLPFFEPPGFHTSWVGS